MNSGENWESKIDEIVYRELRKFPKTYTQKILNVIEALPIDPYTGDIQKIKGEKQKIKTDRRERLRAHRLGPAFHPDRKPGEEGQHKKDRRYRQVDEGEDLFSLLIGLCLGMRRSQGTAPLCVAATCPTAGRYCCGSPRQARGTLRCQGTAPLCRRCRITLVLPIQSQCTPSRQRKYSVSSTISSAAPAEAGS